MTMGRNDGKRMAIGRLCDVWWLLLPLFILPVQAQRRVNIVACGEDGGQVAYAAGYLQRKLGAMGYEAVVDSGGTRMKAGHRVVLRCGQAAGAAYGSDAVEAGQGREAYRIAPTGKRETTIEANAGQGIIYGAVDYADLVRHGGKLNVEEQESRPQMVMRGTCIGLQKTTYLPGHSVYEYPYTPENFPWFYDKGQWLRYLDMMVDCKMNSLYLWNGHPFASLVRLDDYPFAVEVDDATLHMNEEMFSFLTQEAGRRGIWVIQMFYNIILSKPFADHYGLKTQDRQRPITPLIADYTRKSIAAFMAKYPNVGLLVCLGEALATTDDDVEWMTGTIIPGVLDGLEARGGVLGAAPPIVLRSHDTDGPRVLAASLPLYPNIYTMSKYTGESLTTYEPGGPWGETHRQLAAAAPVHIDNVHILANLEPWRWSGPEFIRKAVDAMHRVHHSRGLHLYPQASYWDWPYTADRTDGTSAAQNGGSPDCRLLQTDRDWMWYRAWGRYAWDVNRGDDRGYWTHELAWHYGLDTIAAAHLLRAYEEAAEIAPKLLRRFGITEGNRQTLLLGMTMAQLVNPHKFNIYPGFYESCGPEGEKLIDYVERECKGETHHGELPLDIAMQCEKHGREAVKAFSQVPTADVSRYTAAQRDELRRIGGDMRCYSLFASSFRQKALAAEQVLRYKWTKDVDCLDAAVPFLERSVALWRELAAHADSTYLYANSMQTAQRRIPVGGDNGNFKTWGEMLPVYEGELEALKANIDRLRHPSSQMAVEAVEPLAPAKVNILPPLTALRHTLGKGSVIFENRDDTPVDTVAPELARLSPLVLNRDTTRIVGTTVAFSCEKPVQMLVGFFQDDDPKWAKPPKLETDATGNEYGQAEPVLTNAVAIRQMPPVNVHAYHFPAGGHTIRLPRGIISVLGFTSDSISPRDAGLQSAGDEVDWLFRK